jgi:hypothetical protein
MSPKTDSLQSRRTLLRVTGLLAVPLAGCSTTGQPTLTEFHGNSPVVYSHDRIRLTGPESPVTLGQTAEFTITDTSSNGIGLRCGNPWTLHQKVDGRWRDIIVTSADGTCSGGYSLATGESETIEVGLASSALESGTETVRYELKPGVYRFVLLGTDPFVATNFAVQPA